LQFARLKFDPESSRDGGSLMSTRSFVERSRSHYMPCTQYWYDEAPVVLKKGSGAIVKDVEGNEYIDLIGGWGALVQGHCHPKIVGAIQKQAEELMQVGISLYTPQAAELMERLAKISPHGQLNRVFIGSAGAIAVECAIQLARKATKRYEMIALYGSFHGRTYGGVSLTIQPKFKKSKGPYMPGVAAVPSYYCYRCYFGLEYPGCGLYCAKFVEHAINLQTETGQAAAFIAEPVQGVAGHIPAPDGYFKIVKRILEQYDVLFIDDEIMAGLGRTGKTWAIEHDDVIPDILTTSKALGGGFPISATLAREEVAKSFEPFDYVATFYAQPLACAAAMSALDVIEEERLAERAAKLGNYFMKRLRELAEEHQIIGDVRGRGMLIGVELVKDRRTKDPARDEAVRFRDEVRKRGVLVASGMGTYGNVIRLHPTVVMNEQHVDKSIEAFDHGFAAVSRRQ